MFARPGLCGLGIGRLGLVAAARSFFDPLSLFAAGEQGVWYDPSDLSTLFQDSAGTTPVTAAGQPVGRMLDKSGCGNHATQTTDAARRILRVDENGRYYLAHTGSNTWMQTGNVNFTGTDKMSVFAGVKKLSNTVGMVYEHSASTGVWAGSSYLTTGTDAVTGYTALVRGSITPTTANFSGRFTAEANPDLAVLAITHSISGDLSTIRRNGVAGTNGTAERGTGNFGNYQLYMFRRAGISAQWDGDFYGLIIRGAMSDASQISNAERWMSVKTGVTF